MAQKLREKFLEFRLHFFAASVFGAAVFYFLWLGPSFLAVLSFFKPLLLSTFASLAAVLMFRLISPLPEVAMGEGFVNFVARRGIVEEDSESKELGEDRDFVERKEDRLRADLASEEMK